MPSGKFEPLTIPLYYEGHMYRAGSRIRVRISAPNGDQPIWSFTATVPEGKADVAIGYGGDMPSRVLLPVVDGGAAPTGLPPCPGLRGEPCRDYQPFANAAAPLATPGGPGQASNPPPTVGPKPKPKAKKGCRKRGTGESGARKKRCKKRR